MYRFIDDLMQRIPSGELQSFQKRVRSLLRPGGALQLFDTCVSLCIAPKRAVGRKMKKRKASGRHKMSGKEFVVPHRLPFALRFEV